MEVEDEVHFILKCPFYDDLRNPILQLANLQYPNFTELTDLEQLKVIFQSEDLLKTASFCLNRMYNRRSQMLTSNWLLLNHTSHVYLFDINSAGSILDGYQKIVYKRSDSLYTRLTIRFFWLTR